MMKKYEVDFEYADSLSGWEKRKQSCMLYAESPSEAERKCIKLYGLGTDCSYRIVEVKEA